MEWARKAVWVLALALGLTACGPVLVTEPSIIGEPRVGASLSVDPGTWHNGGTILYVWERCASDTSVCVPIPGATTRTYSPAASDGGSRLRVKVINRSLFGSASAYSEPTAVVEGPATNLPPVAQLAADPLTGPAPLTVSFDGSASHDPDGTIESWSVGFGDGAVAQGQAVTHTYTTAGTYEAELTVVDDSGAEGTSEVSITVTPAEVSAIVLSEPSRWRTFQRDDVSSTLSGHATFRVAGTYPETHDGTHPAVAVDWRFGEGDWAVLDASPGGGQFSGEVTATVGSGLDVRVRYSDGHTEELQDWEVNVGDVFVVTGQSNASGLGWAAEDGGIADEFTTEVGGLPGSLLMNRDENGVHTWYELRDIVDGPFAPTRTDHPMYVQWGGWAQAANDPTGGGPSAAASVWPYALGYLTQVTGVPVGITVVSNPGRLMPWHQKPVGSWSTDPASSDLTAYEELVQRVEQIACIPNGVVDRSVTERPGDLNGAVRAVLHWQGESEATNQSSYAYYLGQVDAWVTDLAVDLGVPIIAAQIGNTPGAAGGDTNVRKVVQDLWDDQSGARSLFKRGPVLYDVALTADPAHIHFKNEDGSMQEAKRRWALAIHDALYASDPDANRGPRLVGSSRDGQTVTLTFDTSLVEEPLGYNGILVRIDGVTQTHVPGSPAPGQVSTHRHPIDTRTVVIEFGTQLTGTELVDVSIGTGTYSNAKRVPSVTRTLGSVTTNVPAELLVKRPV